MKREQQATILVVEDSKNIQDVLMNIFQIVGHCVEIAGDGYEALALLTARPRPFDLVLLDLSMPVMDGIACVKEIHKLPAYKRQMPIIACTGNAEDFSKEELKQAGFADLLVKPIGVQDILGLLDNYLP